jgi:hypothetical protein
MTIRGLAWLLFATLGCAQTQIDLTRQARKALPYAQGGTNAADQITARRNVGTPRLVATDFAGSDIGQQIANAFASFPAGTCGTVLVPSGNYTFSSTIYVPTGCILAGQGRGEGGSIATTLTYNGPPATPAIDIMQNSTTRADFAGVRDLSVATAAGNCPNGGMLQWNAAASGGNKWQCFDGSTFTAPLPHLAGILHGQIDPTVLGDGTHITITNVNVNGNQNGDITRQGSFHFGVWLNGCEECLIQSTYASGADDGFFFGPSSNGVLANQITARLNKRAGIHVRGQNALTLELPLMEANEWWAHSQQPGLGIGFLCDVENLGFSQFCKATVRDAYYEANWLDISSAASSSPFSGLLEASGSLASDVQGYFQNAKIIGCNILNAANVHVVSGFFEHDCTIQTGVIDRTELTNITTLEGDPNAPFKSSRVKKMEPSSDLGLIWQFNPAAGGNAAPMSFTSTNSNGSAYALLLNTQNDATATQNVQSPYLTFAGRGWKTNTPPGSQRINFTLLAAPQTGTSQVKGSLAFRAKANAANDQDIGATVAQLFDNGVFQATQFQAQRVSPVGTVQAAAGTGATCIVEPNLAVSDMSGRVTLTTGTGAWSSGQQCTVSFANALSGWVTLTPANAAAAAAMNARQVYVDGSPLSSQFSISFGVADTAATTYLFNWHAIGNF